MSEAAAPPEAFPLGEAWGSEPTGDVRRGTGRNGPGLTPRTGSGQIPMGRPTGASPTKGSRGCGASRPHATPNAPGDGIRANVAIGGRAINARIPPGVGRDAQAQVVPRLGEPSAAECGG